MVLFISNKMLPISRFVSLFWKNGATRHCSMSFIGRDRKFVMQNTSMKQNCTLIRDLSSSLPLHDVKQLTNETEHTGDELSPAEVLANLSPEDQKRLKVLKLEYDVFMSTGVRVPDKVADKDWLQLLYNCQTPSSRASYYNYLFKREKASESEMRKRAANRRANEERLKLIAQQKLEGTYQFQNRFMLFTRESTMNHWYNNNICYALMNGPHLVFDFSFEDEMKERELVNLVTQLQLCHGDNKTDREPFHFHFCNLPPNSKTMKLLEPNFGNLHEVPYTVTSQHYLDCYDRSRIVYLSPNAPDSMTDFDHDDVYVIGCIVDAFKQKPLTFARAKEEKIRCVRLPLDEHVRWVKGKKSLALNHVLKILLTVKRTNDWVKALTTSMPSRKFTTE